MPDNSTAYRSFRGTAYRKKYDTALLFGGKAFSFEELLNRSEWAYNSFRQMGVEAGEKVLLWLPDCPDLLAAFYGLSRLGAIGVLSHPDSVPREVENQLKTTESKLFLTTPFRYEKYQKKVGNYPESRLILCHPWRDMKGAAKREFLKKEPALKGEGYLFEELLKTNRYSANETPAAGETPAALLFGGNCFHSCELIAYLPRELDDTAELFSRHRGRIESVFIESAFASEGGFLAVHTALCRGKTVVWGMGDPFPLLRKKKPDYLVGTEEFFWRLRENTAYFKGGWQTLSGGIQLGKELTPLMAKFAAKAFLEMGGKGALEGPPVPLKARKEQLYFIGDRGIRFSDLEQELSALPEIAACRCIGEERGIRLQLQAKTKADAALCEKVLSYCKEELGAVYVPEKIEFIGLI